MDYDTTDVTSVPEVVNAAVCFILYPDRKTILENSHVYHLIERVELKESRCNSHIMLMIWDMTNSSHKQYLKKAFKARINDI